jgi:leucyl aminopeptidase
VHLVMSRRTYEQMPDLVRGGQAKRDSIGAPLMMVEIQARQLSRISERIHQRERRCGGYFAFASRADAEAFVRADLSQQAKQSPATAIRYTIDNAATVSPWLEQVQHTNIHATITHLSNYQNRYYASTYGRQAAEWIQTTWMGLAAGRSDVTSELFSCSNCSTQPSVILTIRGREIPNEVVVLGGHLDSINIRGGGVSQRAPGADDDASGIATLTEILRVAMASGWKPRRTVKFMGYAAEEVGLRGSNAIARAHRAAHVNVVAVLQFDMTNYRASSSVDMRLVTDYSNLHLQTFLNTLFDTYLAPRGLTRGLDTCGYACSDHASWTAAGYPSGFFFEGGGADGRAFPLIHSNNDTLANMGNSAQNSGKFAMLGLAFLGEAAKTSQLDLFPTTAGPTSR